MEPTTQVEVMLMGVRLSYFDGFQPYVSTNDEGKQTATYGTHALMEPGHPGIEAVKTAQRKVAQAAWPEKWEAILGALAAKDKVCLHKGEISRPTEEAYQGKVFVSARSKARPTIVATQGGVNVAVVAGDPLAPYSGCLANVKIAIYAQGANGKPSKWGQRINAQLMGVQFVKHGEAFGGGRVAKPEEFGIVSEDADAAPPGGGSDVGAGNDLI